MEKETLSSLQLVLLSLSTVMLDSVALFASCQDGESYSQKSLWTPMQNVEDRGT